MINIFTDEIKNTRFLLTIIALGMIGIFTLAIFVLAILKIELADVYQGAITTLLGFFIGLCTQAFVSHFKNQENLQAAQIENERVITVETK
jgi:energy-coupling factor transporter transmembrane protein EcfT